jgi:pimeloyl-ACP methyl ester carboxylesterase
VLRYGTVRTRRGHDLAFAAYGAASGDRAPVLFVHPINLRKECWLGVASALATDRLCIVIDLASHGESDDSATDGLDEWVSDCRDVAVFLELDRYHAVGGSLGGTIALCLASEMPEQVLSVTALGSAIGDEPGGASNAGAGESGADPFALLDTGTVDDLFATLAVEALAPGAPASLVTTVRQLTNSHGAAAVRRILTAAFAADASAWVDGVSSPVLVVTGEFDRTCSPDAGARMAQRVGGRHEVLPGVGHLPMLEAAEAVAQLCAAHFEAAESKVPSR